ncbi:TusE/DsrC/DsvC family sulfur relay protein [Candidatus Riesia pediculischaeffi]|uniref:Sulfurtransferase n=2 Tax=Candidatus Riesia pediculischaeffi TaxID=428411 RepID=A0A1V0HK40_9ENTR|nr:TusE/DsrC/DsvC family sulfur relay protein [Candidatus Riesia pediculischaeffi]ARC53194.1 hypothetical protein AOQ87_00560 [Candidatus Riesia pediculischaeffi]KIE64168.1 Sulfurtransferase tusE [Candidatus Riesia pediculischaeffi PTSU]
MKGSKEEMYEKDEDGFMKRHQSWNESIAVELARIEKIDLTKDHWKIIYLIRNFYLNFGIFPKMRDIRELSYKTYGDRISSKKLYRLFPSNPILQAAKLAGLPKPMVCI